MYPKGMRAFKTQQDFKELDSELIDAQNEYVSMVIHIPKGSSRARAMHIMHWEAAKTIQKIDHEALLEKRRNLKAGTSRDCLKHANITKVNDMLKATAAEEKKQGVGSRRTPTEDHQPEGPGSKNQ
jgi:hypothetical protein